MSAEPDTRHDEVDGARLVLAADAARARGVTRVAELTGLDRVGVPVFHAVRPTSRSLCVHQGKGLTRDTARLGALMEAIESAVAEAFEVRSCVCACRDLPQDERPRDLADFACLRESAANDDEPIVWTRGERLTDGRPILAPFDCVSLDCVAPWDRRLDHTSNGLAARFDHEGAVGKALLEVLERDALTAWRGTSAARRVARAIDADSIPYPWFREIAERLEQAGIDLALHSLPTIIDLPTLAAELFAPAARPSLSGLVGGWACAPTAEEALRGAVLEALQCRLTAISGVRDDILHAAEGEPRPTPEYPLPPGFDGLSWDRLAEADGAMRQMTPWRIAEALAAAGYPDAAVVRLTKPEDPIHVVKVFAPGLGAVRRERRAPEPRG